MVKKMRIAMLAPPWLPIPPIGYGGIENVLQGLVPELIKLGTEVHFFATGDSTTKGTQLWSAYSKNQYEHILRPSYETGPVIASHILHAINIILEDGNFDVIHDHTNYFGPLAFAHASENLPPVVHTMHNPDFVHSEVESEIPETKIMWRELSKSKNLYFVSLSKAMDKSAPKSLRPLLLPPVHNAVTVKDFPFVRIKSDYFITLSRFHPEKGVDIALRACIESDSNLKMAGVVNNLTQRREVMLELANPASKYRSYIDFRYFSDKIVPFLYHKNIEYLGNVSGKDKLDLISNAKALLFPIQWEEPFGMVVIESLACGTPVVAMDRGAMSEIIKHGKTGFLAKNEKELKSYMERVNELDPADCRASIEKRFSASKMAKEYLNRYNRAIKLSKA